MYCSDNTGLYGGLRERTIVRTECINLLCENRYRKQSKWRRQKSTTESNIRVQLTIKMYFGDNDLLSESYKHRPFL